MSRNQRKKGRRSGHPPEGEPWIWHTLQLTESAAWRTSSIHCKRLINFLEIEHLRHAGTRNGSLVATYNQLEAFGVGRRFIFNAIREAERRGLVMVVRGGRKGAVLNELNRFRLTYAWTMTKQNGLWDWHLPTDDWKGYEDASIGAPSGTPTINKRELPTMHKSEPPHLQAIEMTKQDEVSKGEPPYISGIGDLLLATDNPNIATAIGAGAPHQGGGDQHLLQDATTKPEDLKPLGHFLDLSKLILPSKDP
jgi:hypothetical protein